VISALLLAAGAARRFGAQKLLQDLHGRPVVRWSAEALMQVGAVVGEVIIVVPPDYDALRSALQGIDAYFVVNPHPALGIASSIACGITALSADTDAVIVSLADEPLVSPTAAIRVLERYQVGGAQIVAPTYAGIRGHPVLFDKTVFDELRTFSGDDGARPVVDRDPRRVAFVEMGEPLPQDIDTPEDLARLRGQPQFTSSIKPKLP
jgi:molybdenum cofactor cytidylyltransferase